MTHTKKLGNPGVRRVVRKTRNWRPVQASPHKCNAPQCGIVIQYAPDKKYCSDKCRKIARADADVVSRRGSGYEPKFAEQIDKWLDQFKGIRYERVPTGEIKTIGRGKKAKNVKVMTSVPRADIPTLEAYARHMDVALGTLYAWRKSYPAFEVALQKLESRKKELLNAYGLTGVFNSKVTSLHLMSDHDMKERNESQNKHVMLAMVRRAYELADEMEEEQKTYDYAYPKEKR